MTISLCAEEQPGRVLGQLNFTLEDSELDHDPAIYTQGGAERPRKSVWKELHSLRPELDDLCTRSSSDRLSAIRTNLARRGFATVPHHSQVLEERGIETQSDFTAFVKENLELLKIITGADEVILWNSTKREATATTSETTQDGYELQSRPQGVSSRFDKSLEPPALFAHIDQDPYQGRRVCSMAIAGTPSLLPDNALMDPVEATKSGLSQRYSRTMIINLWRPVGGTVYDKPLAIADYTSLKEESISRWASPYGCGYDVHENEGQKWYFVPEQTNDEVLVFKCFDSLSLQQQEEQGEREALYGAHCAVAQLMGTPTPPSGAKPRKSVEFRFVAVWR
ncbi:hypothetical protein EMMF5_001396 [Cystobasidiomycetes sp. EMM_F5]